MKAKSWQTTAAGVITALIAILSAVGAIIDGDPATNPNWEMTVAAVTTAIGLILARDNNKTSESVGAK